MAEVRKGVDRVKELMERHDVPPSEAERLNSYDDGVRRSQQFADRRAEIDAGVAAARARATSMRDRYSGGARRRRTALIFHVQGVCRRGPGCPFRH